MPEKFVVKKEDGTTDWEATALKVAADGYTPLERRLHAGDAPPKAPEDYAPTVPPGMSLEALKADPLYQGFLKGAHARGMTNAHVSYVLDAMAQRSQPDLAAAEQTLREHWKTEQELERGLSSSYRGMARFAGSAEAAKRLEAKFGNDPDFILFASRIGAELSEDVPAPGLSAAENDSLESLMASPAYFDAKHPEHARTVARARALYAKKYPDR